MMLKKSFHQEPTMQRCYKNKSYNQKLKRLKHMLLIYLNLIRCSQSLKIILQDQVKITQIISCQQELNSQKGPECYNNQLELVNPHLDQEIKEVLVITLFRWQSRITNSIPELVYLQFVINKTSRCAPFSAEAI